ncbi:MAG: hypothetical protein ABI395_09440 [Sphingobium sp.]
MQTWVYALLPTKDEKGNFMPISKRKMIPWALLALCPILAAIPKNSLAFSPDETVDIAIARRAPPPPGYADIADLTIGAPLVITGRVKSVKIIKGVTENAPTEGYARALITTQVLALIRGEGGIAPEIRYLVDIKTLANGRIGKLKNQSVLIFAKPADRTGFVQLVSRNAQMVWSKEREETARAVTAELLKNDAPPRILAVGDAFYNPGTVTGEGETQIFLKTATGAPVSLSVLRRPGQPPKWGVSLGELVDDTALPPERNTLLWYRLACSLPGNLPDNSVRGLSGSDTEAARIDYSFIIHALGTCGRTL